MIRGYVLFVLILISIINSSLAQEYTPPAAKKVPNQLYIHGDTLTDNYFWLRDKNSSETINYLYAENAYADNCMKGSGFLQKVFYEEFKSRKKETYNTPPEKQRGYYYFRHFEKGKDYPVIMRKKDSLNAPEKVVLDINEVAKDQPFMQVSDIKISPDQQLLYYGADAKGNRVKDFFLKYLNSDSLSAIDQLKEVMSLIWAENNQVVYYTKPEPKSLREYRLYKHVLGTSPSSDALIYEEADKTINMSISLSTSRQYMFLLLNKTNEAEVLYMKADGSANALNVFLKRTSNVLYSLEHIEGNEFYVFTNKDALNNKLCKTVIQQPDPKYWQNVIPHQNNVLLTNFKFTKNHLVLEEKENAQDHIRIIDRTNNESEILSTGLEIGEIGFSIPDYDYNKSEEIKFTFSNMITPSQTCLYNLRTKAKTNLYADSILGGYNPNNYEINRIYASAQDGKLIPITLCHKKGMALNGNNPLYLSAYGSYGASHTVGFGTTNLSLLERGFVVAIAHIRGSNDLGKAWYEDGKMFHKKNTFTDFISCTEHLINQGYTSLGKIAVQGGSAGGLLMGAIANMRPDLFKCIIANVPFVDVINTMLDETLPLTTFEFEEWGNPKIKSQYQYMRSYSPYDNVEKKAYPNMLVTAGYNDSQVAYWEPAKWVSKLREFKTDTNLLLFKTNMDGGHGGASGKYGQLKEIAFQYAFIMRTLGIKENYITIKGKIIDEKKQDIPFVNVYIEGSTNGTTANSEGAFELNIKEGQNPTLVFQTLGYIKHKEKIELNTSTSELIVTMKSENVQLNEVVIKGNTKDPAYAIMREAIKKRKENLENVRSYSADVYMKSGVNLKEIPKKLPFFINKKDMPDSNNLGLVYLSESVAKYYFQRPDHKKEEMIASKVAGTKTGFSFNRVEDVFVNFYEPSINASYYSERPFVSPLATGSLLSYKYKYLGTFYIDNKPVHKIKIIPRRKGDPLFQGEIYITEENYQIYSCDLFITKDAQIDFADTVHMKQEMIKVNDSLWVPLQLQIYSHIKIFGFAASDLSTASISNYKVNQAFPKKFFNNEVFKIEDKANKKDSAFWANTRPAILSKSEEKYYIKGDSTLKKQESKEYKDSVAKASRKPRFGLNGFSMRNELTGESFTTSAVPNMISYNTIEGLNFTFNTTYSKRNPETRQRKSLSTYTHYGSDNKRWNGGLQLYNLFKPKTSQSLALKIGRFNQQFNSHEPIGSFLNMAYTLFNKDNFMKLYQKDLIELAYTHEFFNGLYSRSTIEYQQREALINRSFYYFIENDKKHFTTNNPQNQTWFNDSASFKTHQALQLQIGFKFIPFCKFETYPNYKRILPSKWPELSFLYRKGMATKNATFNYDYLEAGIGKDLELRLLGLFSFDIFAGVFYNTNNMNFTDYKHFNGNQTMFLMNKNNNEIPGVYTREAVTEFHALDYYKYSTNSRYLEVHATHNFRGFFIGKIPLLRKTKFYEMAGINALYTPSSNYTEAFIGIDKIFKIFRFDIGSSIQSNQKLNLFYRFGLRIGM